MNYNIELLKKPYPFASGNMTLWENAYIAKNVLKKHLDKSIDSGSRKWNTILNTVEWICKQKPDASSVLDIGCGPGLYARLFYNYGILYTGIDISPYQIEYAKHSNSQLKDSVSFYMADLMKWEYTKKYDIVLLLYGIYSFFPRNERVDVLKKIRKSLSSQGCVVIEVFTSNHYAKRREEKDWIYIEKNGFWSKKPHLELNAFYRFDDMDLVLIQAAVINKQIMVWNSWIQTFSKETLEEELKEAGFRFFEFYGSCTGETLKKDSEVICVCAF